jgi:hypothetical protein
MDPRKAHGKRRIPLCTSPTPNRSNLHFMVRNGIFKIQMDSAIKNQHKINNNALKKIFKIMKS